MVDDKNRGGNEIFIVLLLFLKLTKQYINEKL